MEIPSTETSAPAVVTVAEYSKTEAALTELRVRLGVAKYDVTTAAGMEVARKDKWELVKLRTSLEAKRKEIKAPALAHCNLIDAEAKRITLELAKLEKPIDDLIKAEDERKEKEEQEKVRKENERIAAIRTRIDKIKSLPLMAVKYTASELQEFVSQVELQSIGIEFEEFTEEATSVKTEIVGILNDVLTAKKNSEQELANAKTENDQQAETLRIQREALEKEQAEFNSKREPAAEQQKAVEIAEPAPSAAEEAKPAVAATETVTIPKSEYEQLLADSKLLNALRNAGVDNWDGWDFAMEALEAA